MGRLTGADASSRELDADGFRDVIGHFASGVTIVTTAHAGARFGTTASAVSSLSLEPPMVLVCLNRRSATGVAIGEARAFAINILSEDQGMLADRFASKVADRFDGVATTSGAIGQPLLDEALAQLECRVTEQVEGGTHSVFLAEVESGQARSGAPLAYFRGQFGRLDTALDATVYEELRERLLRRRLPVGQTLELLELADELQVPAGALYHALGKLSSEGMIERTPTGGFVVPPITWSAVEDALSACAAIEVGAVELTARNVSDDELAGLTRAMEASLIHVSEGRLIDVDRSLRANEEFHEALVGFTRSEALLRAYRRLALPGLVARTFRPHVCTEDDARFGTDHREIVEGFGARDPKRAGRAVRRHYERTKDSFNAALRSAGGSV